MATSKYRLGVDVGGTNTDCVLIERIDNNDGRTQTRIEAIASYKTATTPDVTSGIESAIQTVLEASEVSASEILSLNIGTTHFINAVIEMNVTRLSRVAVLRLCGPFCREITPFEGFPPAFKAAIGGHVGYLDGGLEVDGRAIMPIDKTQVIEQAAKIKEHGDQVVVIVGVSSPIDSATVTQEEIVKNILAQHLPNADIATSRDIGGLGFVERQNAAILNASIVRYGRRMITAFQQARCTLGLDCPLYVSQNDGTVLEASLAASFPMKTFSSGATNSLTDAAFLAAADSSMGNVDPAKEQVIVVCEAQFLISRNVWPEPD